MTCLAYRDRCLYVEGVNLSQLAQQFGTPCYVYSKNQLIANWQLFDQSFSSSPHRICYAVKANSNLSILKLLAKLQSGFDIVSLGELERVLAAGGNPQQIIFSGVGKKSIEIEKAILAGIYCFNVESLPELDRLNQIASHLNKKINIALRVNPDVDPCTHAYISTGRSENKFGIASHQILEICSQLNTWPHLNLIGLASHIGSQITELAPFLSASDHLLHLYRELNNKHIPIKHINIGGGLGIVYHNEQPPSIHQYSKELQKKFAPFSLEMIIEPGRAMIGNAGILLTQIEYLKTTPEKNFAIVDAGMNDLLRPALYDAWQNILPVLMRQDEKMKIYDIVGPVCESADFLGKNRELAVLAGDLLAIDTAGAYGFSMTSNYNSRFRPPEILVDGGSAFMIRRRETMDDLLAAENFVFDMD